MSTLYLIRHGQASFGRGDYDRLSDLGWRQARITGGFFLHADIRFDSLWRGGLTRQRQTADAVAAIFREAGETLPPCSVLDGFNEYDAAGVMQALVPHIEKSDPGFSREVEGMMSDRNAFQTVFSRVMTLYASGRVPLDGIPAWVDFCDAVQGAIAAATRGCSGGSKVAVFTSGGPIAAAVGRVLGLDDRDSMALSWQLVNASVTRLRFSRGRIGLSTFNEYAHLEQSPGRDRVTYR